MYITLITATRRNTYSEYETRVNSINDTSFTVLHQSVAVAVSALERVSLSVVVEVVRKSGKVGSWREFQTVSVSQRWVVSSLNGFLVVQDGDFAEIVGQSFEVVPGQDLLIQVIVLLTTAVVLDAVLLAVKPEWVVEVEVVVKWVNTDVFSEVRKRLFRVKVQVPARVVSVDGVSWRENCLI